MLCLEQYSTPYRVLPLMLLLVIPDIHTHTHIYIYIFDKLIDIPPTEQYSTSQYQPISHTTSLSHHIPYHPQPRCYSVGHYPFHLPPSRPTSQTALIPPSYPYCTLLYLITEWSTRVSLGDYSAFVLVTCLPRHIDA